MDRKDIKVLEKILEHSDSIIEETKNIKNADDFKGTNDKSKAALFDLMQIGELVNSSLSRECIKLIDNIPWEQIYALRNRIVHGYAAVDYKIVWDTIKNDIPKLKYSISKYIEIAKTSPAPPELNADLMTDDEIRKHIQQGLEDVKEGRVVPFEEFVKEIEEKFDIK